MGLQIICDCKAVSLHQPDRLPLNSAGKQTKSPRVQPVFPPLFSTLHTSSQAHFPPSSALMCAQVTQATHTTHHSTCPKLRRMHQPHLLLHHPLCLKVCSCLCGGCLYGGCLCVVKLRRMHHPHLLCHRPWPQARSWNFVWLGIICVACRAPPPFAPRCGVPCARLTIRVIS